jgi:hypothetical protein
MNETQEAMMVIARALCEYSEFPADSWTNYMGAAEHIFMRLGEYAEKANLRAASLQQIRGN